MIHTPQTPPPVLADLVVSVCHDSTAHCKDGHASGTCAGQAALDADGGEPSHRRHVLHDRHVLDGLQDTKKVPAQQQDEQQQQVKQLVETVALLQVNRGGGDGACEAIVSFCKLQQ